MLGWVLHFLIAFKTGSDTLFVSIIGIAPCEQLRIKIQFHIVPDPLK